MKSIIQLQKMIIISLLFAMFSTTLIAQEIEHNKTIYGPVKPNNDAYQAYALALSDTGDKVFTLSNDELSVFDVSTPSNMTVEHYGIMSYDEFIEYKDDAIEITGEKAYNKLVNDSLTSYSRMHYGIETYDSILTNDNKYEFLLGPDGLYAVKDPNVAPAPITPNKALKNDFNGDGIADILWRKGSANRLWLMHANGSHTYKNIGNKKSGYYLAGTGDFNGDGITDILWRYKSTGTNHIWYMHADGSHTYKNIGGKNKKYFVAGTGDFNGDGITDILWRTKTTNHIWYMKTDGKHKYKKIGGKRLGYSVIAISDFSGDGIDDILWVSEQKYHYIWSMNSDGTHGGLNNFWSGSRHVVSRLAGYFNNDGKADVFSHEEHNSTILYTKPSSDWDIVTIYSSVVSNPPMPSTYKLVSADDFNGDGISDILWRDAQGKNVLWMMQENGDYFLVDIGSKSSSYTPSELVSPSLVYQAGEIQLLAAKNKDITRLDVSHVTDMRYAFLNLVTFNQAIGDWDVSHVKYMKYTFSGATSFNQPIGDWDVSNVVTMPRMFKDAERFNQPIGNWDVSNVKYMYDMFRTHWQRESSFNQPIGDWDVSNVKIMSSMFAGAGNFNQPIGDWDVSKVEKMNHMFEDAKSFNQPIGDWDITSVKKIMRMFSYATSFNQPIGDWDVSHLTSMYNMFEDAKSFNQPLNNWDVSNVEDMQGMFDSASSFNQPLASWNVSNVFDMSFMFMTATSFDQDISSWDVRYANGNQFSEDCPLTDEHRPHF